MHLLYKRTGICIHFLIFLVALMNQHLYTQDVLVKISDDQCINCHIESEVLPEDYNLKDIHLQSGLSCSGCHGGDASKEDMDDAMSKKAGYRGVPDKKDIPGFCGRCHSEIEFMRKYKPQSPTDQVTQYYTSIHGQKLKGGDKKVADCVSCHSAHSIFAVDDSRSWVYALNVPATCNKCHGNAEYMKEYKIPVNQYSDFASGVHGKALLENQDTGAPSCNDCHGNHGAMPPGISSISHVCGLCHVNNMQYFSSSKMATEFDNLQLHACEECHGNHKIEKTSDAMSGVGAESVCVNCHTKGDAGYISAQKIHEHLTHTTSAYDSAETKMREVQKIGMDDVDISFLLQEAHQSLIEARTLVHTFDPVRIGLKTGEGIKKSRDAIILADSEIKESKTRRMGLGFATTIITLLVVALYFKIREIERKES